MSSVEDTTFTFFWIASFAIGAVVAVLFFGFLTPVMTEAFSGVEPAQATFTNFNTFLPDFFSWVFGIILVALPLIALGLALLVPINNFWWWVFATLSVLLLGVGYMIQSWWGWFSAVEVVGDAASQITPLVLVMDNFAVYSVLVISIIGIGTYVKQRRQGFGGVPGGFR